jgi:hypothetical protein
VVRMLMIRLPRLVKSGANVVRAFESGHLQLAYHRVDFWISRAKTASSARNQMSRLVVVEGDLPRRNALEIAHVAGSPRRCSARRSHDCGRLSRSKRHTRRERAQLATLRGLARSSAGATLWGQALDSRSNARRTRPGRRALHMLLELWDLSSERAWNRSFLFGI